MRTGAGKGERKECGEGLSSGAEGEGGGEY